MEPASTGREADGREADGREADGREADGREADGREADEGAVLTERDPVMGDLADVVNDLQPITASTGPFQTTGLRVERFGRDGPDGVGRYWQWRWWEVNADGRKARKGRYGGIINAEATEYWQHRSSPPASTG